MSDPNEPSSTVNLLHNTTMYNRKTLGKDFQVPRDSDREHQRAILSREDDGIMARRVPGRVSIPQSVAKARYKNRFNVNTGPKIAIRGLRPNTQMITGCRYDLKQ